MSLINDALKQARQAQQEQAPPPAPNLQLRPIEPSQYTRQGVGLLTPAALLVIALLLLMLVWQQARRPGPAQPTEVKARTAMVAPAAPAALPAPPAVNPAPAPQPAPAPAPAPASAPAAGETGSVAIAAVPLTVDEPTAINPEDGIPNAIVTSKAPPAKPVLPKLQAIIFTRTRPSAMVGGKTLYVGDKLDAFRVAAISRNSVTLVGMGQTNVIKLPE